jgi:hypothetical protein
MTRADDLTAVRQEVNSQLDTRHVDVPNAAPSRWLAMSVGLAAIGFTAVYLASDILEVGQGHLSPPRLALT